MNRRTRLLAVVLAVGALGTLAFTAHGHPAHEMRHEARAAWHQALWLGAAPGLRDPQRLADQLVITPAQKPAWDAYVATLAKPAEAPSTTAVTTANTAPERLERALAETEQRSRLARQRLGAMKTLHVQLTPAQREVFDAVHLRAWHHHST